MVDIQRLAVEAYALLPNLECKHSHKAIEFDDNISDALRFRINEVNFYKEFVCYKSHADLLEFF